MSVLPLMPSTIPGKWDLLSPSQLGYKMDRPTYSTPAPVENIPANNECRMVEVMGSKVASFKLDEDDYICLPQAFEFFLKHLVGGLHTVYTKLKRLNITPVVCNVEQVRILRGIGAIQPGVNRCKLITKGDFETLYQDCTTASRPGRPPKRYPLLPLSAEMITQQSNPGSNNSFLTQSSNFATMQKRIRLSHCSDISNDDRANNSPTKTSEKCFPPPTLPILSPDIHSSNNANLAYIQALRQYQQVSTLSGLQSGLDSSQQLNPALAQLLMLSNPGLFSTALPPTSIAMFNHFNQQIAQQQVADATSPNDHNLSGSEDQSNSRFSQSSEQQHRERNHSPQNNRTLDSEGLTSSKYKIERLNSFSSEARKSPEVKATLIKDNVGAEAKTFNSRKESKERKLSSNDLFEKVRCNSNSSACTISDDAKTEKINVPSTQALLTEIQGLLKLAASSVNVQERRSTAEIEKLRAKLNHEKMLREVAQQKLDDCEKERAEAEKQLCFEKEERKKLNNRLFSMQHLLNRSNENSTDDSDMKNTSSNPSSPLSQDQNDSHSVNSSSNTNPSSEVGSRAETVSPGTPASSPSNFNTNNNASPDQLQSPDFSKRLLAAGQQRLFFNNPVLFQPAALQ